MASGYLLREQVDFIWGVGRESKTREVKAHWPVPMHMRDDLKAGLILYAAFLGDSNGV